MFLVFWSVGFIEKKKKKLCSGSILLVVLGQGERIFFFPFHSGGIFPGPFWLWAGFFKTGGNVVGITPTPYRALPIRGRRTPLGTRLCGNYAEPNKTDRTGNYRTFSLGADAQPYQRSGHCCATDGNNLYVFGGYHPEYVIIDDENLRRIADHNIFRDLWCYNFATKTWYEVKTSGDPPAETASMSMILSGNTLICFGGTLYPWGSKSNNNIYTLNLTECKWKILECLDTIPAKYGQAMTLHDGALYVFGGCRRISEEEHLFDSELHRLDMKTHKWSLILGRNQDEEPTLSQMRGMYRHGLACYQDKLYVIGSSWEEITTIHLYHKVHVYDITEERWSWHTTIPTEDNRLPQRRAYHSCAQWKSEVYMCGGHDSRYYVMDDIWCLHLPELRWERLSTSLPVPSFFHSAAITDTKCMYLFGGVRDFAGRDHRVDRVRTRIIQKIWLAIPSLAELCWLYLLDLCPHMAKLSRDDLIGLGIPRIFTERLKQFR